MLDIYTSVCYDKNIERRWTSERAGKQNRGAHRTAETAWKTPHTAYISCRLDTDSDKAVLLRPWGLSPHPHKNHSIKCSFNSRWKINFSDLFSMSLFASDYSLSCAHWFICLCTAESDRKKGTSTCQKVNISLKWRISARITFVFRLISSRTY